MKPDYKTRLAQAKKMYSLPIGQDLPRQKFKRGDLVVIKNWPPCMSYFNRFGSSCNAIIEYSYAQKYGGNDINNYSVSILDENNEVIDSVSWYPESAIEPKI